MQSQSDTACSPFEKLVPALLQPCNIYATSCWHACECWVEFTYVPWLRWCMCVTYSCYFSSDSSEVITTLFTDAPTTMNATEQETEADHINNRDIVQSVIYITTVAVASFIIVMLLAIILCMGCCICYQNGCRRRERGNAIVMHDPFIA